ncbi:hypothetical protein Tsubulata_012519 [Turnera subulata]|uniref:Uncharacterized protein n=1 Tax=Turnera subulata TaxID=218843 RepID=A0A9Q0F5E5_9ROSI|nr:hypothetical protein Tsubulata_012519 [Turnera subulata]
MDVALGDDESWWCLCAGAAIEHDAASIRVSARLEVVLSTTYGSSHRRRPSAECGFDRSKRWCADLKDGVHIYPWLEVFEQILPYQFMAMVVGSGGAATVVGSGGSDGGDDDMDDDNGGGYDDGEYNCDGISKIKEMPRRQLQRTSI